MDTTATFWLPTSASTISQDWNNLWSFVFWIATFFFLLIVGLLVVFAIKYRRREGDMNRLDTGPTHNNWLEAAWIGIPTLLVLIIFVWGFKSYMRMFVVPSNSIEIKVTGQKWFWSFAYPEGQSSVNELYVPANKPIKLLMSSQDVIHAFYVPAFRIKHDVLPNRYSIAWFQADDPGDYDLFCAEYCGTNHSKMTGTVHVLSQSDYNDWLSGQEVEGGEEGGSLADRGEKLYKSKACVTCHSVDGSPGNGPTFKGAFGHTVRLSDGSTVTVDENYVRESILNPKAKVVEGFQPIMPTFQGVLKDKDVDALVAYIKSLGADSE